MAHVVGEELPQRSSARVWVCNPEVSCGFDLSIRSLCKGCESKALECILSVALVFWHLSQLEFVLPQWIDFLIDVLRYCMLYPCSRAAGLK